MTKSVFCLFLGHSYRLISHVNAPNDSSGLFVARVVTYLLMKCERCAKIKEKRLRAVYDIPQHEFIEQ